MAYEYKELVDKMEEFENIYKKENETRVFWEKWESGDGEIDDWDSLVDRNKSVMKDIEELISKLKDALRKKREIRIEMKHYENGIRYINVRNYNDRKTAYENEWKRIYKKFSHINFIKFYNKKEFPSLYASNIPHQHDIKRCFIKPMDISISENWV